jgi:MerR family copper efflux transcriptional regulator
MNTHAPVRLNIGQAAKATGVPAKTIRYYESIGLMPRPARAENNYRFYGPSDVATLKFIHRARLLGFSLKDVAGLLELWRDKGRASADVKALAVGHVRAIERRIAELESIRRTLIELTDRCHGDGRPDCPILGDLAGGAGAAQG